jgi:tetratricopeptide (TPR) repeat protein
LLATGAVVSRSGQGIKAPNSIVRADHDKALALKPQLAEALTNLGNALKGQNRFEEALACYDKALALNPESVAALNNCGDALFALRRPAEALAAYDRAVAIAPTSLVALNNRGNALRALRRPVEALASYSDALATGSTLAEIYNNRGGAFADLKRFREALADYDRALALKPDFVPALVNRGGALCELKQPAQALESCDKALALAPDCAEAWNNRSNALIDLNRPDEALANCDKALALKPDYAEAYDGKGVKLMFLGRFEEATRAIEAAIAITPRARFYYNLTLSKRLSTKDDHLAAMEDLARNVSALDEEEQVFLRFALGKALKDVGDHENSFAHLLAGNAIKRKQVAYDGEATDKLFDRTKSTFTRDLMRRSGGAGCSSETPIFILGMPRSGTTLVEQILASHPKVFGAGERDDFSAVVAGLGGDQRSTALFPEFIPSLPLDAFRRIGADYVDRLRGLAPTAGKITDKMPENFRFVGLIHLALPKARIIHLQRGPVDTCLSCFATLFYEPLDYTYDLKELGRYYRAYQRLMDHWREILPPGVMLDVRYEDIVDDIEGQARRMIAHCGLEWDARCLDFHRANRPVRTASMGQARQPLYKTSVGRWRAYEGQLGPLLDELNL